MHRVLELIFGLDRGFLSREGELNVSFNPAWPGQEFVGAWAWNLALVLAAALLVVWVYRREGRSRNVRVVLGVARGLLLALVIALLNRPVVTLSQSRIEPSVLAVLIDDSASMRVRDAVSRDGDAPTERLKAAIELFAGADRSMLERLSKVHQLKFYHFSSTASRLNPPTTAPAPSNPDVPRELDSLVAEGQGTQVAASLRSVVEDLQGQRLAGIVLLSDGRDAPAQPLAATLAQLNDLGTHVYPIVVGSEETPTNIAIQSVSAEDSAFKGDIANVRVSVRGTGTRSGRTVKLQIKDKKTGSAITDASGKPVEADVSLATAGPDGEATADGELQFIPSQLGQLDLLVEAQPQPGELDDEDNRRELQITVLDSKINVLYVDGYPRWEYRYLKNEMIRDQTIDISCLLTSADPNFIQEGDRPITRFPESLEEMLDYDVVIFGDVDPRQFSDAQLQLVADFVSKRGGGFGMVAGPRWSPQAYRGTAIEPIIPVNIARAAPEEATATFTQGFRPVLTRDGANSSIFRFFPDREANARFLRDELQPIYWYARGISVKPGVGEVLAEHPLETGPDGRRAPILVLGRFGGGRTLFSAIDDSWRWRFYTGESIFDTYWVQQLRYLARSKKLGQRRAMLASARPVYELGQQASVTLRIVDPQLLQQLPEQIRVDMKDASGAVLRQETLVRQEGQPDLYSASFTADRIGKFTMSVPPLALGLEGLQTPIEVSVPRLELAQPQVDRPALSRIAQETHGQVIELKNAARLLPDAIPSAAKVIPIDTSRPLWDAPLAMIVFLFLITAEWLVRKMNGML